MVAHKAACHTLSKAFFEISEDMVQILLVLEVLFTQDSKILWLQSYKCSPDECSIGEWFRTTVGVRQGCRLSPTLFNIFLARIMSDALEERDGKVSIGGRILPICGLPMT